MLAYRGKKKELVNILSFTESGAVAQYEAVDKKGCVYMPLIENGENVEKFIIAKTTNMLGLR